MWIKHLERKQNKTPRPETQRCNYNSSIKCQLIQKQQQRYFLGHSILRGNWLLLYSVQLLGRTVSLCVLALPTIEAKWIFYLSEVHTAHPPQYWTCNYFYPSKLTEMRQDWRSFLDQGDIKVMIVAFCFSRPWIVFFWFEHDFLGHFRYCQVGVSKLDFNVLYPHRATWQRCHGWRQRGIHDLILKAEYTTVRGIP